MPHPRRAVRLRWGDRRHRERPRRRLAADLRRDGLGRADEVCARAAEVDDRAFVAEVFARRKIEGGDVEGWVARKQELTLRLLADSPQGLPGRRRPGRAAPEGQARLGVVTTTWRANVEAVLEASGLREAFELIIAKEDVKAAKPDPEGYRLALARLKLPAGEVVALEDSPSGLAAARGAGVRVVAVGHRRAAGEWAGEAAVPAEPGRTRPGPGDPRAHSGTRARGDLRARPDRSVRRGGAWEPGGTPVPCSCPSTGIPSAAGPRRRSPKERRSSATCCTHRPRRSPRRTAGSAPSTGSRIEL